MNAITTKVVELDKIITSTSTQIRASINHDAVDRYATEMVAGDQFPHPVVYQDGESLILADGFHRFMAAKRNGDTTMRVEVHNGGKADALRYALSANSTHGLPRTNADKRRSVELALAEWPKLSSAELARLCAVSDMLVKDVRDSNIKNLEVEESRTGRDGKTRKLPKHRKPEAEPPADEYRNRLEALTIDAIKNASDNQLRSIAVYAATVPNRIKAPTPPAATEPATTDDAPPLAAIKLSFINLSPEHRAEFLAWCKKRGAA